MVHESDSITGTYVETSVTAEVYPASVAPDLEQAPIPIPSPAGGAAATFTRNSLISVGRLLATTVVALVLPAYLTHRLPVKTYSAWVLLLQMSAYVGYLDFGVQTAVAKYVAEFEAKADSTGAGMRASAGLALMSLAAVLGVILTLTLAWRVPHLFAQMPPALYPSVRISLVLIGVSLSLGLLGSFPSAIFLGLQRYSVPMVISLLNRALFTIVVVSTVFLHGSLAIMGAGVAAVNVATGMIQISAWRRMASHVRLSFAGLDRAVLKQMLSYCSVMGIWTVGMLCVSGLDVTIVGHFDFGQTAFYSIATLPTNFILSIMGAALGTSAAGSVGVECKSQCGGHGRAPESPYPLLDGSAAALRTSDDARRLLDSVTVGRSGVRGPYHCLFTSAVAGEYRPQHLYAVRHHAGSHGTSKRSHRGRHCGGGSQRDLQHPACAAHRRDGRGVRYADRVIRQRGNAFRGQHALHLPDLFGDASAALPQGRAFSADRGDSLTGGCVVSLVGAVAKAHRRRLAGVGFEHPAAGVDGRYNGKSERTQLASFGARRLRALVS